MGTPSVIYPGNLARLLLMFWLALGCAAGQASGQNGALLRRPAGIAFAADGSLYFTETSAHQVRKLDANGVLSTVAGSGIQGFAGDGGAAGAAQLNAPGPLAVDAAGNVYVGDIGNHRIRRIDAATGVISTIAGSGAAGLGPDGVSATLSALDEPVGLALDAANHLYFADARRHVVRRIDLATGLVRTVAGTGRQGFAGDSGSALLAAFDTPTGLAVNAAGDVFVTDTGNHRIRRVDATGIVTTIFTAGAKSLPGALSIDFSGSLLAADFGGHVVSRIDPATGTAAPVAGTGVEGFFGDGAVATAAILDSPHVVAISPAGLVTIADTSNGRLRQIDAQGIIHTIVGPGAIVAATLTLAGPASVVYGTGSIVATVSGAPVPGTIVFAEGTVPLGSSVLAGNQAVFSTAGLAAGIHLLTATTGPLRSTGFTLTVTPAPVAATAISFALLYGQALPPLAGTLTGVLPQDASSVTLNLSTTAGALSPAGTYAITASIGGSAARNYALSANAATIIIAKAPSATTLSPTLALHVGSSTTGIPSGTVSLLDGGISYASAPLSAGGDAQFSTAALSNGSHTLSASYAGDGNFLASTSPPQIVSIGPTAAPDFTLATTGSSSVAVVGGSAASFNFVLTPTGVIPSQTVLSASGLPPNATATFTPSYLPPGSSPAPFVLTIQTVKNTGLVTGLGGTTVVCLFLPLWFAGRKRRARMLAVSLLLLAGCGDRTTTLPESGSTPRTYSITVNATATTASGATLLHSTTVTLTIQ